MDPWFKTAKDGTVSAGMKKLNIGRIVIKVAGDIHAGQVPALNYYGNRKVAEGYDELTKGPAEFGVLTPDEVASNPVLQCPSDETIAKPPL